jgi:murein DD-endopeptidase MepM/ murein hydrolase activator NlpD
VGKFIWPVKGRISQGFGRPALKVEPTMYLAPDESRCRPTKFDGAILYTDVHPGLDIVCKIGTPVLAPADGVIVDVIEYRIFNPFSGRYVTGLQGRFRFLKTSTIQRILLVDHLSKIKAEGSKVLAGKPWAWTGDSGIVTGPHAHLEDRQGPANQPVWKSGRWYRLNPTVSLNV